MRILRILLLLFVAIAVRAGDPISPDYLIVGGTWEGQVGVEGGIPSNRTFHQGFTHSATLSQINAALASCPSNSYVALTNSGPYTLNGAILIDENGVTLRGITNGPHAVGTAPPELRQATVQFNTAPGGWDINAAGNFTTHNVSSGATRGSTRIVLSTTPSTLSAGRLMWISSASSASVKGGGWSQLFGNRPASQVVMVTNVSGTTVDFRPAFNADYWSSIQVHYRAFNQSLYRSGVEDVYLNHTGNGSGNHYLQFYGTSECWAQNVKTRWVTGSVYHAYIYLSYRTELRKCEFTEMAALGNSTYGIMPVQSSHVLIIDNRIHNVPNIMPMMGWSASAFAYNYCTNFPYSSSSWLSQMTFHHQSHQSYILVEGNWFPSTHSDGGGGSRNMVWFRNRMLGWDGRGPKSGNTQCFRISSDGNNVTGNADNWVVAANVLGKDGYHTLYNGTTLQQPNSENSIYEIDTTSNATLQRLGNYNTVNDAAPAGEAIGGGDAFVDSYLFSSKPSWFGILPFPWCDPGNYSQSNESTNMPAGHFFVLGTDPPPEEEEPEPPPDPLTAVTVRGNNAKSVSGAR